MIVNNNPTNLTTTLSTCRGKLGGVLVVRESGRLNNVLGRYVRGNFNLRCFGRRLANPRCTNGFVRVLDSATIRIVASAVILRVARNGRIRYIGSRGNCLILSTGSVILTVNYHRHAENTVSVPNAHPTNVLATNTTRECIGVRNRVINGEIIVLNSNSVNLVVTEHVALRNTGILTYIRLVPCSNNLRQGVIRYLGSFSVPLCLSRAVISVGNGGEIRRIIITRIKTSEGPIPNARVRFSYSAILLSINLVPRGRLAEATSVGVSPHAGNTIICRGVRASYDNVFTYNGIIRIRSLMSFMATRDRETNGTTTRCILSNRGSNRGYVRLIGNSNINCAIPRGVEGSTSNTRVFFHIHHVFGGSTVIITSNRGRVTGFGERRVTPNRVRGVGLPGILLSGVASNATAMFTRRRRWL